MNKSAKIKYELPVGFKNWPICVRSSSCIKMARYRVFYANAFYVVGPVVGYYYCAGCLKEIKKLGKLTPAFRPVLIERIDSLGSAAYSSVLTIDNGPFVSHN